MQTFSGLLVSSLQPHLLGSVAMPGFTPGRRPLFHLGSPFFGGPVAAIFSRPHRYIFLSGVLGVAITAQIQACFWARPALHPQDLDPAAARTIFAMPAYWGPLVNGSTATMGAAIAALAFGLFPMFPRWLTWLGAVLFLEQAIETVTVFGQTGFIAPGGAMNVYLGGAIGFLWVAEVVHWAPRPIDATTIDPGTKPV